MSNLGEIWMDVPDYVGTYQVSNYGRVRSVDRTDRLGRKKKGQLLAQHNDASGRPTVGLRGKIRRVCRLVLLAFVGPAPEGMECCHNDGNPGNNRLENLRWDTRSSNTLDAVAQKTNAESRKTHCPAGHELSGDNLVKWTWEKKGHRLCAICHREKSRESYYRRKEAA